MPVIRGSATPKSGSLTDPYIRSLGPAGTAAPAPVGPGGKVSTPYIDFMPHN
jgi:hypothetical protein